MTKKFKHQSWITTHCSNENGHIFGGFNFNTDKRYADVYAKPSKDENGNLLCYRINHHYENVSHRVVDRWLQTMQELHNIK